MVPAGASVTVEWMASHLCSSTSLTKVHNQRAGNHAHLHAVQRTLLWCSGVAALLAVDGGSGDGGGCGSSGSCGDGVRFRCGVSSRHAVVIDKGADQ
jgi:hypothetical protein